MRRIYFIQVLHYITLYPNKNKNLLLTKRRVRQNIHQTSGTFSLTIPNVILNCSIPIGHSTRMKTESEKTLLVLREIKYEEYQWLTSVDLEVVNFLLLHQSGA